MKTLIQYAVIRFMPFAETQEFANVGILVFSPKTNFINFKLAPKHFPRINQFFEDLDGKLYSYALESFDSELVRVKELSTELNTSDFHSLMSEVTRPREGILTFSELGAILSSNAEETLDHLYANYVGREFKEQREYRESQMARALKKELFKHYNVNFKEQSLDIGYGKFKLPLVANEASMTKAIKPLSFNQNSPLQLADHGDKWVSRIKHLLNANALLKENFLFAIEKPKNIKPDMLRAFDVVTNGMQELGVNLASYDDTNTILDFAQFDVDSLRNDFELI